MIIISDLAIHHAVLLSVMIKETLPERHLQASLAG